MSNNITFMYHPACSKTPKTQNLLEGTGVEYTERNLEESMVTKEEILEIAQALGSKVHDLLRPASPVYTERQDELHAMSEEDLAEVMSGEPTLIKRPIVKTEQGYVIGLDAEKILELVGAKQA